MILAFPDVQKAASDIKNIHLDWEPLLCLNPTVPAPSVVSHTAFTEPGDVDANNFGDAIPPGLACVAAQDGGMNGFVQTVQISAGTPGAYSVISAQIVLSDGTNLTRSFLCVVQ